jgi:hypothetical protein
MLFKITVGFKRFSAFLALEVFRAMPQSEEEIIEQKSSILNSLEIP